VTFVPHPHGCKLPQFRLRQPQEAEER